MCAICGHEGSRAEVAPALALYPDGYSTVQRCRDHRACRRRVEAEGDPWPLVMPETRPDPATEHALQLLRQGSDDLFLANVPPPTARRVLDQLRRRPEPLSRHSLRAVADRATGRKSR